MTKSITLENLLEDEFSKIEDGNPILETKMTFDILKNLFVLNKEKKLSQESKIFLKTSNSAQHISNIIRKVFYDSIPIKIAIDEELIFIDNTRDYLILSNINNNIMNLKKELKEELIAEMKNNCISNEAITNLKEELIDDIRQELKYKPIDNTNDEKFEELKNYFDDKINSLKEEIITDFSLTIKPQIIEEILKMNDTLTDNIKKEINDTLTDNIISKLKEEMNDTLTDNIISKIKEEHENLKNNLLHTEERIKQTFFRRASKLHSHITHAETFISELGETCQEQDLTIISEIGNFKREIPVTIRDSVGLVTGRLVPKIINTEITNTLIPLIQESISEIILPLRSDFNKLRNKLIS